MTFTKLSFDEVRALPIAEKIEYMRKVNLYRQKRYRENNKEKLKENSKKYRYDYVFIFKPWKEIFVTDGERYESFKEAKIINTHIEKSYKDLNYSLIEVPFDTVENRSNFILNWLKRNL